jgi:hypothetical protein
MLTYKDIFILQSVKAGINKDEIRPYLVDLCHAGYLYQDNGYRLTPDGVRACLLLNGDKVLANELELMNSRAHAIQMSCTVLSITVAIFIMFNKFHPFMLIPYLVSLFSMLIWFHGVSKRARKYMRGYFAAWKYEFDNKLASLK